MVRIGVICPSEIAFRRFLPALQKADDFQYIGVAFASAEEWFGKNWKDVNPSLVKQVLESESNKAQTFVDSYGGKVFLSYDNLISSEEIDAIYLPLPPALHYKWAEKALMAGKHVFVEKPSTTSLADTQKLIRLAEERGLAIHEDYMFVFHNQVEAINDVVKSGELGDVRLYRVSFGFPRRDNGDFRYRKVLGGGALLDCGGYTMKYASLLLGETAHLVAATSNYISGFDVDMYGSATMMNDEGLVVQLAFGMDNDYKCEVEIWGSKGALTSGRILTAPVGFVPTYTIKKNNEIETRYMPSDDSFLKSIQYFGKCIREDETRFKNYLAIERQETFVDEFRKMSNMDY